MSTAPTLWPRAIILIDMNAFFASIEQQDNPSLRGQPIAVINGNQGTCIITCSYEARIFGIKTGMRLREAKQRCPHLIQVPGRSRRYAQVSRTIMAALIDITPDIEIFSVDEAFLDVTRCQQLHGTPEYIGQLTKQKVYEASGLPCSVGVSGDKTTAKYAAKLQKPDGFVVIPPWEAKERLQDIPVTELCGIAQGIGSFLAKYGVYTCGDMQHLPISVLAKRFGNLGRRIWYMCQGADPDPVNTHTQAPKSMGHGKIMPPNTRDIQVIHLYLQHMSEKLAARLRRHHLHAQTFFIGLRHYDLGWLGSKVCLACPTNDGKQIFQLGQKIITQTWHGLPVCQIQVTALDPQASHLQEDLFAASSEHRDKLNAVIDHINARYGEFVIAPAPLIKRTAAHDVIAPAWKPYGPRQTV